MADWTWFPDSTFGLQSVSVDLVVRATLLLLLTITVNALLRKPSAALRHAVHSLGLLSLLLLPVLSLTLPAWPVDLPVSLHSSPVPVAAPPDIAVSPDLTEQVADSTASPVLIVPPTPATTSQPGQPQNTSAAGVTVRRAGVSTWSMMAVVWLLVAGALLLSTVRSHLVVGRLRRTSTESQNTEWLEEFERLTAGNSRLQRVRLLESASIRIPIMCGILRPAIILPAGCPAGTAEHRYRVLAHELSHVQRWDVAIHLAGRIACCLYWFHPLAWWCLRQMRQEREYACDDRVLAGGGSASAYAEQLLTIARDGADGRKVIPAAIAMSHGTNLERRIRLLFLEGVNRSPLRGATLAVAAAVFCVFTATIAAMQPATTQAADAVANPEQQSGDSSVAANETTAAQAVEVDDASPVPIQCVDSQGSPVAGAEVHLYQGRRDESGDASYVHFGPFISDKRGHVECPDAVFLSTEQTYDRWVYARLPGQLVGVTRSTSWTGRDPYNKAGVVKMQPSQPLDGQLSLPDGFDPANVLVRIQVLHVFTGQGLWEYESFARHDQFMGLHEALPQIFTQRPDPQGRFQFQDIPVRGRVYLLAEGSGLGQGQWWNGGEETDKPAALTMQEEGRIAGQVLSPDGAPVENADVSARIISDGNQRVAFATTFRTTSDQDGRFLLDGLPDWDFVLSATDPKERWVVRPIEDIRVNSDRTTRQNLELGSPIQVSGRVLDSDGNPVQGATLSAISDSKLGSGLDSDSTNDDGQYRLSLSSGPVRLYFSGLPDRFVYPDPQIVRQLDLVKGQADLVDVDITLQQKPDAESTEDPPADAAEDTGSDMLRTLRENSKPILQRMARQHGYKLEPDQLVGHVSRPFPAERMEYYRTGNPSQAKAIPAGPSAMTYRWNGEELSNWGMTFGDLENGGYSVAGILNALAGIKPQFLNGPDELLNKTLPGDWVVREDSDPRAIVQQLNRVFNEVFELNVQLEFRSVEQDVYVARGNYRLTPLQGENETEIVQLADKRISTDHVHIFGKELVPDGGGGGGSGDFDELLKWLGRWIDVPVINDVRSHPKRQVTWRQHSRSPFTEEMRQEDHDPEAVLRNMTRQTQLQFTKERRPIEILFVVSKAE